MVNIQLFNHFFNFFLEDLQKLRDYNINIGPNSELAEYHQTWINQINNRVITDEKLKRYIEIQITYWLPLHYSYSQFLSSLLTEYLDNATK